MSDLPQKIATSLFLLTWVLLGLFATGCASPYLKEPGWVWPLPPEQPRLRYVGSLRSSRDIQPKTMLDTFKQLAGGVSREVAIVKPYGVTSHQGVIYVTDTILGRLLVFDRPTRTFKIFGTEGPGRLNKPIGVAVDNQGRIYVTDAHQRRVVVYGKDGAFIRAMGGQRRLVRPVGVAVHQTTGKVYVVDAGSLDSSHHAVSVYHQEGQHLFDFGQRGTAQGEFNFPTNITIGRDGRVYVVDTGNFRVQVFDSAGNYLDSLGTVGTELGAFARPKGIALDSEDHIYVVDAAFNNIQIFDQQKRLLLFAGQTGRRPGELWLPAGIHIDASDRIYIADQYNHRIQIWQYLKQDMNIEPE